MSEHLFRGTNCHISSVWVSFSYTHSGSCFEHIEDSGTIYTVHVMRQGKAHLGKEGAFGCFRMLSEVELNLDMGGSVKLMCLINCAAGFAGAAQAPYHKGSCLVTCMTLPMARSASVLPAVLVLLSACLLNGLLLPPQACSKCEGSDEENLV